MTAVAIMSRIDELENEIRFLKAQVRELKPDTKAKTFGDLYGIWEGKVDLSEEDFKEAELQFKPFPS